MMTSHLAEGAFEAKQILCAHTTKTSVLTEGVVLVEAEGNMKDWGLNLAALLRETLYQLQDGVTAELCVREGRAL